MGQAVSITPYQKFKVIFEKWIRFTSISIGLNILDKDFTFKIQNLFIIAMVSSVDLLAIYTMFAFDTEMFWKAATCLSLGSQAAVKVYTVLYNRPQILFLASFLESIYSKNDTKVPPKTRNIMEECSTYNLFTTATLYVMYLFCVFIFYLYPVIAYAVFEMKEPWLPLFVPGLDINTKEGFVATSIYHCVVLYLAGVGFGFCDSLFFNLVFNIYTMSELQGNQLAMLDEEMSAVKPSESMIRVRLTNFFLMHQEMEKYIELINESYFLMIFVQIMTTSLCTTLIAYIIMTMSWYPAYFLAVCLIFQMFLFCALGTVVEIANDRLEYAVLQTKYYLLRVESQHDFKFIINVAQKARFLKVGSTKLDVTLFVLVMRKIYAFIMFLNTRE
ncbi:putative odorant receptor 83c [Contarinia nasturtii]|uniref:putative odorant receptor 83c n=1 Tax=Contarinia nasturtii TaxID=265458 RepID=UPI0012D4A8A1|nr:putative odorant receptor 83c [Contarinia nasturtii]